MLIKTNEETGAGAVFSDNMLYRFKLWRSNICPGNSTLGVIMLNPSIGTENVNSKTLSKCIEIALRLGHSRLIIGNLFAYRSPDPTILYKVHDPVGANNDGYLIDIANSSTTLLFAWGNYGTLNNRASAVATLLHGYNPRCIGSLTSQGQPRHPINYESSMLINDYVREKALWASTIRS